jgi:hypothetical protein
LAQDLVKPGLTFQEWKDQQILEAQNQVLRINTRIAQSRTKKTSDSKDLVDAKVPAGRIKKVTDSDTLALFEKDLRRANDSVEAANGLTVQDYINIYLPTLQNQPESVGLLADKLSKEDLALLFKSMVNKSGEAPSKADDAKRGTRGTLLNGVSVSNLKGP